MRPPQRDSPSMTLFKCFPHQLVGPRVDADHFNELVPITQPALLGPLMRIKKPVRTQLVVM